MKLTRYMNYKVRCNACGTEDRVSTELWTGNQARRAPMVQDIFYTRGWREYEGENGTFCPECARKYLLMQGELTQLGGGYYELRYRLSTGMDGRQIFAEWSHLISFMHEDLAPSIQNMEPDEAYIKIIQRGTPRLPEEMDYAFSELGYVTSIEFEGVDTSMVTNTQGMFSGAAELREIIVDSAWDMSNVELGECMFEWCSSLEGDGQKFDATKTGVEMATYDGYLKRPRWDPAITPPHPEPVVHPSPRPDFGLETLARLHDRIEDLIAAGNKLYNMLPEDEHNDTCTAGEGTTDEDSALTRMKNEWGAAKIRVYDAQKGLK